MFVLSQYTQNSNIAIDYYTMFAQQFISESCSWFHREESYPVLLLIQKLSGTGLNRLGSSRQCSNNSTLRYFLLDYSIGNSDTTFYTGICYTSNCTASDLTYIVKSLNQYITLPFTKFNIVEPSTEADTWNSYSIVTMTILGTILLINILATILNSLACTKETKMGKIAQIFSIRACFKFMLNKSKNYQRMRIIAGFRAFAFLGMAFYSLTISLMQSPSLPQPPIISKYVSFMYYFFDLWLMIGGFYLAIQLSKEWSKYERLKSVLFTVIRHCAKIIVMCLICMLITISVVRSNKQMGPLWTITFNYFESNCNFGSIFGECNYWLLTWVIQIQMCIIQGLLFVLWHAKIKFNRVIYFSINLIILILSVLFAAIFGKKQHSQIGIPEGNIRRCPIVGGICYLIGFNFGLAYFWFRTHRNKTRILMVRLNKYKITRILATILSLSFLTLIILYFSKIEAEDSKTHQLLLQLFRIATPICYILLIIPEFLGFQNIWGALFKDRFMNMASKLSFSSFTIYYLVCTFVVNSIQEDIYVNFNKLLGIWIATVGLTLTFGLIIAILIQVPVYRLLHIYFGRSSPKAYIQFY